MSVLARLQETNEVALSVATELERVLGGETLLTIGLARSALAPNLVPTGAPRVVATELEGGIGGELALVFADGIAAKLEELAPDELLVTSAIMPLQAGAEEVVAVAGGDAHVGETREVPSEPFLEPSADGELAYPFLDGDQLVACLVVRYGAADDVVDIANAEAREPAAAAAPPRRAELGEEVTGALSMLQNAELEVTAELGRRRMTLQELLSLTPGAVLELDGVVGSAEVLVNGMPIGRGEVVVVDEEFGIRISELIAES